MSAASQYETASSFQQGLELYRGGNFAAAVSVLETHASECPRDAESLHVLALCYRGLSRFEEGATTLAEVVRQQPENSEAWSNYGAILREVGRLDTALSALETATQLEPGNDMAWNNLGTVLLDLDDLQGADRAFQRALELRPDCSEALANLSRVCYEVGDLKGAWRCARSAIALAPGLAEAHNRLSFVQASIGELEASLASLRRAVAIDPANDRNQSNLLLRSLGSEQLDARTLYEGARDWGVRFPPLSLTRGKPTSIQRIGFLSGDLFNHPVGHFLHPLLLSLEGQVEVVCYSTSTKSDNHTAELRNASDSWRDIHRVSLAEATRQIHSDDLDVLVDLSGHTGGNRLDILAQRAAPLQVSWLGFSGTTGLPQMDAILVDSVLVPEGEEGCYTERVLRLPDSFLCVEPAQFTVPTEERGTMFGVFNNPAKFSETCYRLWAEILERVPESQLLIKYHYLGDRWAQSSLQGRFEELGIDPDRIVFSSTLGYDEHLATIAKTGIALDTFPYSGATTTLDCLAAGTPVVTLAGDRYSARMSASLLIAIGRADLVTDSEEAYVETAVRLAATELWRARTGLQSAFLSSSLCDAPRFAAGFLDTLSQLL